MKRLLVAVLLPLVACGYEILDPASVTVNGSVEFLNVEGGCWVVQAASGKRYEPVNLPPSFKQDGLQVAVTLRPRTDVGSFCMVGDLVEIVDIQTR